MIPINDYMNTTGRIFDIQKFSVHDGPGIRTIVFLKGCFLRCKWCCNPESQNYEIEQLNMNGKISTAGRDVTVAEVIEEVLRDRPYYRRSGGGMTISGGEALFQPEFAADLLRAAKEHGISTALESTGFAPFETIQKLLPYLDYYLLDIKHTDPVKHKNFTGVSNERILENAPKIAREANHLIIRVPVIPTFNATREEISEIARFAASLPGVREIHLLPYHRLGMDKYKGLGRKYLLSDLTVPTDEQMQQLCEAAASFGLKAQIGG